MQCRDSVGSQFKHAKAPPSADIQTGNYLDVIPVLLAKKQIIFFSGDFLSEAKFLAGNLYCKHRLCRNILLKDIQVQF